MPSPTTGLDIIKTAMRFVGVLGVGETPSADQTQDALNSLNDILETWSTESLAVYGGAVDVFNASVGVASYTIGATGAWVTPRPVRVDDAFVTLSGVDFPVEMIGQTQYDQIAFKTTAGIPEQLCFVNDYPNALVYLYPVPSQAMTVSLNLPRLLTSIATAATAVTLPPGYVRALQWALAAEIASQYGTELTPAQLAQGRTAYSRIKRANRVPVLSAFDLALTNPPGAIWQRGY